MRPYATLLALTVLAPALAVAQPAPEPPPDTGAPIGLVLTAGIAGGSSLWGGTEYTRHGLFEGEVTVGYELAYGLRPEVGLAMGVAPTGHVALRPGVHYAMPETPFYLRGALDWSTVKGAMSWRWLLTGAGVELRLTDVLGGFAEVDVGWPFRRNVGLGVLVRAGVSFRF